MAWYTNMGAVSLFWNTNIATVAKYLNALFCHRRRLLFSHFPVNIWVALFMAFAFHRSTFFQLGVHETNKERNILKKKKLHWQGGGGGGGGVKHLAIYSLQKFQYDRDKNLKLGPPAP